MKKIITDERTGLHYELVGDYYLIAGEDEPEQEQEPIGIWGQQHLRHLKRHHKVIYANLLTSGKLPEYLADIDRQAEELFLRLAKQMASCFGSFPFKGDERRFLVAPEYNAEVVLILFAFRNCACHIVVQPHDDLAEADLASCVIVPVIEIAFDVVGTPFHKLFLKVSSPCL